MFFFSYIEYVYISPLSNSINSFSNLKKMIFYHLELKLHPQIVLLSFYFSIYDKVNKIIQNKGNVKPLLKTVIQDFFKFVVITTFLLLLFEFKSSLLSIIGIIFYQLN